MVYGLGSTGNREKERKEQQLSRNLFLTAARVVEQFIAHSGPDVKKFIACSGQIYNREWITEEGGALLIIMCSAKHMGLDPSGKSNVSSPGFAYHGQTANLKHCII
jgi:hypothetical protein